MEPHKSAKLVYHLRSNFEIMGTTYQSQIPYS